MANCDDHEWVVFSTCLGTIELMCQCAICGAFGVVPNPTKAEWSKAGQADERPYRFHQNERVVIKKVGRKLRLHPKGK